MQNIIHHIETGASIELEFLKNWTPNKTDYSNWDNALLFCKNWSDNQQQFNITTSGSTGAPKAIKITREQMKASAAKTITALDLKAGDNFLVGLNTEYIAGQMMLVRGLEHAMNIYVSEPSANPLSKVDAGINFDFTAMVPLQIQTIVNENGKALERLNAMKAVIIGGAPISYELHKEIETLAVPAYATYGMTETVSHIALKKLNGLDKSEYYQVLDRITVGQDGRGCLTIKGDVSNNELITTNDIVELNSMNQFKWIGRADNVINSGGIKIHPEQLEEEIASIFHDKNISDAFFIDSLESTTYGEHVALFVEGVEWSDDKVQTITDQLKSSLQPYLCPKEIVFLELFERTPTGKIKRAATKTNYLKKK